MRRPLDTAGHHPNKARKPRHPKAPSPAALAGADAAAEPKCARCGHSERDHSDGLCHGWDGPFSSGCLCTDFTPREPGSASD